MAKVSLRLANCTVPGMYVFRQAVEAASKSLGYAYTSRTAYISQLMRVQRQQ